MRFFVTFVLSLIVYLLLVISGGWPLVEPLELLVGVGVAAVVSWVFSKWLIEGEGLQALSPGRWGRFFYYLFGPFFVAMVQANIDVAKRVITGEIRPGIIKISPGLKTDMGITVLANSITLTPGTLTVDINEANNDLYIHWIYVTDENPDISLICGDFPAWARRITE